MAEEKPSILFIDDETFFTAGYFEALGKDFNVTIADHVSVAEEKLQVPSDYQAAIVDVMMPVPENWPLHDQHDAGGGNLTGVILLRRFKAKILGANVPIIILTHRNPSEVRLDISRMGFPDDSFEVYHKRETPSFRLPQIVNNALKRAQRKAHCPEEGKLDAEVSPLSAHSTHPAIPPFRPALASSLRRQKLLFLAANPTNETRLALDKECREIEAKIRASEHRDSIEMLTKYAVRPNDLLQYLHQHTPHIVHFSGHGSQLDEIILLDTNGEAKPVSKAAVKQLFTTLKDNIRVVVLNACFSQPQAQAITEVIDCAIGMNREIGDDAAIVFAAAFYQAIGFGRSVKVAFESGRAAMLLEGIPEDRTPVLLVRAGVNADVVFLMGSDYGDAS